MKYWPLMGSSLIFFFFIKKKKIPKLLFISQCVKAKIANLLQSLKIKHMYNLRKKIYSEYKKGQINPTK